jgi:RNA polymerase sigma-70 factor (ECF subfamily)
MAEAPQTRPSLLLRLRDPRDGDAWRDFLELYAPVIYAFGRKSGGLQDADAADLTQAVLQAVSSGIGRFEYEPAKGGFRAWLFAVVRNQLGKWRRSQRQPRATGETADLEELAQQPAPDSDTALWEQEYKRQRFQVAAQRLRPQVQPATCQAFWQTAVEGRSAREVANELGLKLGALYTAKSRVLALIKKTVQTLAEE